MKKNKSRNSIKSIAPIKGGKKSTDVLKTYSFPEYGVSIQAIDLQSAKIQLNKRLKGEN